MNQISEIKYGVTVLVFEKKSIKNTYFYQNFVHKSMGNPVFDGHFEIFQKIGQITFVQILIKVAHLYNLSINEEKNRGHRTPFSAIFQKNSIFSDSKYHCVVEVRKTP